MRIALVGPLRDGPWGGGNQFMKALRGELRRRRLYTEKKWSADVLIVNSHHFGFSTVLLALRRFLGLGLLIHRVDGPVALVRADDNYIKTDRKIWKFNSVFADGTVFQSQWSLATSRERGFIGSNPVAVIQNAVDPSFFFDVGRRIGPKVNVAITSWSSNVNKGFDLYSTLDREFDSKLFEITFVGNSPIEFERITMRPPMSSEQLGNFLRSQDVYLTASRDDTCSNALLEGIACGLFPVAIRSGGNPEIVGENGILFDPDQSISRVLIDARDRLLRGKPAKKTKSIQEVCDEYLDFIQKLKSRTEATH